MLKIRCSVALKCASFLIFCLALTAGCKKSTPTEPVPAPDQAAGTKHVEPVQAPKPGPLPQAKRPPLGEPKYSVKQADLTNECLTDAKGANAKYAGAVIELSAITYNPPTRQKDQVMLLQLVHSLSPSRVGVVTCLDLPPTLYGKLLRGQQVRLKGRVKDVDTYGAMTLVSTEVVELGPDVALDMTALEVAQACAKDPYELRRKCGVVSLRVSGKVIGKVVEDREVFIELEGDGKTRVLCHIEVQYQFDWRPTFAVGDSVVFAGIVDTRTDALVPGRVHLEDCYPLPRK